MLSDTLLSIFLALNVVFLLGTAAWFRFDHASSPGRFQPLLTDSLIDEVMWQYSLRSNLLLFGCTLSAYLLYIGEIGFLLACFACFSVLNMITDALYVYDEVALFPKVKKGHQIAGVVIWVVAVAYWISKARTKKD
ncbi:expressed unknown protein [Seminavis robusta]|uniref:Uncharacterized protein n=1 Tax=Seminavis robusta TaxID=568900 RepID=A0A9N8EVM4_9STRA|nr:expressed unknown protein [Seminavis robusta]|eukprot:Sro1743_g294780.1 n/a (136) ;mRNA; r:10853-11260